MYVCLSVCLSVCLLSVGHPRSRKEVTKVTTINLKKLIVHWDFLYLLYIASSLLFVNDRQLVGLMNIINLLSGEL